MRISAKGRYALAALMELSASEGSQTPVSVISVAEKLEISKIFLEQIFSALKKEGIVVSTKGKHGGYKLAKKPSAITALDALKTVESGLFESSEPDAQSNAAGLSAYESSMNEKLWNPLNAAIEKILSGVTISELYETAAENTLINAFMMNM